MPLPHSLLQTLLLHGACPLWGQAPCSACRQAVWGGGSPRFSKGTAPSPTRGALLFSSKEQCAPAPYLPSWALPCAPRRLAQRRPRAIPRLPHPGPVKKALGRPFFVHFPSFWASQPCNSSEFYLFSLAAGRGILLPAKGGLAGDRPAAKAGCVSRWSPKAGSSFYSAGRRVPWVSAARAAVLV